MGDRCGISATDRVLQFASPAFDTAVEETLMALTRGATLVLRSEGTLGSARTFLQACERWRISVLDLPTSLWHTLVEDGAGWPATVRLVIIGGEAARPELVGAWSRGPGRRIRLLNSYGPTEASIAPLCTDLSGWCADRHVPIGRPIANVHAYVVDRAGVPVPRGLPGELVIGGAAVARGYRSNADDTRERFTADQWLPGGRVYRTGDRVRVNGDGDVEFIGRLDGQVKIRGYRIEPAEIEARLERHPSVRAAAVVAVRTEDELALTAFVEGPPSDAGGALLGWVRAALPASMIPARIVVLADLPRTAGGKVDRPVLSALTTLPPRPPQRPLGTAVERWIARIWSDVLHVPVTDADAHFFELGGHSLSVMRTVARLEEDFRIAVPPSLVFECPTIGLMAAALHRAAAGAPVERIADLLLQIDAMSDAEVEAALLGAHVHDH